MVRLHYDAVRLSSLKVTVDLQRPNFANLFSVLLIYAATTVLLATTSPTAAPTTLFLLLGKLELSLIISTVTLKTSSTWSTVYVVTNNT